MKKANAKAALAALAALPEGGIDVSDIPEVGDWSGAKRGLFYRPVKQQLTLRLDAEVVAWFKRQPPGSRRRHLRRAGARRPGRVPDRRRSGPPWTCR